MKWQYKSISFTGISSVVLLGMVLGRNCIPPTAQAASNLQNQADTQSALSAGPSEITKDATLARMDAEGNMHVFRPGTNGWVCMPGNPNSVADPPMCEDKASQQWDYDFRHHLPKPTNKVPGITYMLAGAEQRSDTDPNDKTSAPIKIGPHWMILWPFDPKTTGLPAHHKATGAYIMWAGTPYAHVHIMGGREMAPSHPSPKAGHVYRDANQPL